MKVAKKENMFGSGSVKLLPSVHKMVVDYCREEGIKVSYFVTQAAKEKLQKEKK